jgi:hypothetical protein
VFLLRKERKIMFKKVWKILDPESRFVGSGGPVEVVNLPAHLNQVHQGAGQVEPDPASLPGIPTYTRLQRPAALSKFGGER